MSGELIILRKNHQIYSLLAQEHNILQIHLDDVGIADRKGSVGDIYVGKVKNIVKNINAAFVEYTKGQMGYLSLAEKVLPRHAREMRSGDERILAGDEILVQIKREAVGSKPPTLSGVLDLTGRYAVLRGGMESIGLSKKIAGKETRESIRKIMEDYQSVEYGLVARTNSAGAEEAILRKELAGLVRRYERLIDQASHAAVFTCLEMAPEVFLTDIRDGSFSDLDRIITDDEWIYEKIQDYLQEQLPELAEKLVLWDDGDGKLEAVYNVKRTIKRALDEKVWLKSGAYLVIQPTEALVSIDVNTGKAISKKKDVEKTFYKINTEAAREIAFQLRLRNLSGMILVDFIDMKAQEDNASLLELFRREVKKDPVGTTVVDMTKLGLVEVTRKKIRKPLYEVARI